MDEKKLRGNPFVLTQNQLNDLDVDVQSCISYKQLDKVDFECEDTTYFLNDAVFIEEKRQFGIIINLLEINKYRYADVNVYEPYMIDEDTGVAYTSSKLTGITTLQKLQKLSSPHVTANEGGNIWFINFRDNTSCNNRFAWFDSHILL